MEALYELQPFSNLYFSNSMKNKFFDLLSIWFALSLAAILIVAIGYVIYKLMTALPYYIAWLVFILPVILTPVLCYVCDKKE